MDQECIDRAKAWQSQHQFHVHRLIVSTERAYPPTGSDAYHPELWKPAHWKWFVEQRRAAETAG